VNVFRMEMMIH